MSECQHLNVRETVDVRTLRYDYVCVDCEVALDVDPDEYARCQAGETDDFEVRPKARQT